MSSSPCGWSSEGVSLIGGACVKLSGARLGPHQYEEKLPYIQDIIAANEHFPKIPRKFAIHILLGDVTQNLPQSEV